MCDDRGAASTDVLGHTNSGTLNLALPGIITQLENYFDNLVYAGGSNWMTTGFEAAHGGNRDSSHEFYISIESQARGLSSFSKTTGLERKCRHDRESVMQLKKINIFWPET